MEFVVTDDHAGLRKAIAEMRPRSRKPARDLTNWLNRWAKKYPTRANWWCE